MWEELEDKLQQRLLRLVLRKQMHRCFQEGCRLRGYCKCVAGLPRGLLCVRA